MTKRQAAEMMERIMFAKHNAGHADEQPGMSWDLGVKKAITDLRGNAQEHNHFVEGYIKTIMEYDELMRQDDPKGYVDRIEKECT
jgi:hypothetical protein